MKKSCGKRAKFTLAWLVWQAPVWAIAALSVPVPVQSQVVTDGTVGAQVTLSGQQVVVEQSLGTLAGSNLFHSFSNFDISTDGSVTFTGAGDIDNVISRVTGGVPSTIAGMLTSTVGNANFYFFNPSGVVLTGTASIDVPGSLHLSTATDLSFSDGRTYSADLSQASALTMAAPEAFGFLPQSGDLSINNAVVSISSAGSATLAGADIEIENSAVNVNAGELSLVTLGDGALGDSALGISAGQLPLNTQDASDLAGLFTLQGSSVEHSINSTGDVYVRAGRIVIDSAHLESTATGLPDQQISITTEQFEILNGGEVAGDSQSQNGAIDINVVADNILIDGQESIERTGIFNQTDTRVAGSNIDLGGEINVNVAGGKLEIVNGGLISGNTSGVSNASDVTVVASDIVLDRNGQQLFVGIESGVGRGGDGNGGEVKVTATNTLSIAGGAEITGSTFGSGDAGSVTVSAGEITLDGGSAGTFSTGISSQVNDVATGNGGDVVVTASGAVNIRGGARITASTFGAEGDGGTISVTSGSLTIEEASDNENFLTGVIAQTHGSGAGGAISIVSNGEIDLTNGGLISSGAFGAGDAGDVTVTASDIVLDRQGEQSFTGIASGVDRGTAGDGGNVTVTAINNISIAGGAEITGSTFGSGNAGSVTVNASEIALDGSSTGMFSTGISSQVNSGGTGNGGDVIVNASGAVNIRGGARITASTFGAEGDGGSISLTSDSLTIEEQSTNPEFETGVIARTDGSGAGGEVSVVTNGEIRLSNGGLIRSGTIGSGNAGDVAVTASDIVLDRQGEQPFTGIASGVDAEVTAGDGGNVTVTAINNISIAGGADITGSTFGSGNAGSVTVNASEIALDGSSTGMFSTGISSQVNSGGTGNGGDVIVNANGAVNIRGGARITTATFGTVGNAGAISLTSDSLTIEEQSSNPGFQTGVIARTDGAGTGGDISIATGGEIRLIGGGLINSSTFGAGGAGDVNVTATNIMLDRQGETAFTGITSGVNMGAAGDGGNVTVTANNTLLIANGAEITGSTFSAGNSGTVNVTADALLLDGNGANEFQTGISSQANPGSSGNGGSIDVNARELQIASGARITVATFGSGQAGVANINARRLIVRGQDENRPTRIESVSDQASQASAGGLFVNAGSIVLNNGLIVSSTFDSDADGGDIAVTAGVVAMDSGGVQANANSGAGGDINIDTDAVLTNGGDLQVGGTERVALQFDGPNIVQAAAPGGINGEVALNAPELDIAALVSDLDSNYYDAKSLAQNPCDAFNSGSQSSLVELSVGGIPTRIESSSYEYRTAALQQNVLTPSQQAGSLAPGQGTKVQGTDAPGTDTPGTDTKEGKVLRAREIEPVTEQPAAPISTELLMSAKFQWSVVRSEPRIDGAVVTSIAIGHSVTSLKRDGDWHQVKLKKGNSNIEGFMHQSVLQPVIPPPVSTSLNRSSGAVDQVETQTSRQASYDNKLSSYNCVGRK